MLCDLCGKKEANVHLTEIIDSQSRELHLCGGCAKKKGTAVGEEFGLSGLLAGLTDLGTKKKDAGKTRKISCPRCGMTYEDFRKSGRLGCGVCYQSFRVLLAPLLRRIHGSIQHAGKTPPVISPAQKRTRTLRLRKQDDQVKLKVLLKKAIAMEEFEQAAELRDQIKGLKSKSAKQGRKHGRPSE